MCSRSYFQMQQLRDKLSLRRGELSRTAVAESWRVLVGRDSVGHVHVSSGKWTGLVEWPVGHDLFVWLM
jgi:hypothetical protein